MEVYNHIYSPLKVKKDKKENKFKYFAKKDLGERLVLIFDIIYFCMVFFIILIILLSPVTYLFRNPNHTERKKIIIILEIVVEVILIISIIYISHWLAEKLDIFRIKGKNHHELRRIGIHAVTGIGVLSMHVIMKEKIEHLFGGFEGSGFFG